LSALQLCAAAEAMLPKAMMLEVNFMLMIDSGKLEGRAGPIDQGCRIEV
jgi:hypothetical protein